MGSAQADELRMMAVALERTAAEHKSMSARLHQRADMLAGEAPSEPSWLIWAREEIGITEIPGPASEKRVEWYHGHTAAGEAPDSVPWCSSFVCAAFSQQGIRTTRSKAAVSWMNWGKRVEVSDVRAGDVLIFKRSGGHHVAFYVGESMHEYLCLGGNQKDMVRVSPYGKGDLLGIRRPVGGG